MDWRRAFGWIGLGIATALLLAGCGSRPAEPATQAATESASEVETGDPPVEPPPPPDENAEDELGFSSGGCRSALSPGIVTLVATGLAAYVPGTRATQKRKGTWQQKASSDVQRSDAGSD